MYGFVLLLHVLGATIWTGGHLVLAFVILPGVLREKAPQVMLRFEAGYERIGIPALIIQVATGVWLAWRVLPDVSRWLAFDDPVSRLVGTKLTLLAITAVLAADARLRIIPRLTPDNLLSLALHIVPVTLVSILFVAAGVSFRTGWMP